MKNKIMFLILAILFSVLVITFYCCFCTPHKFDDVNNYKGAVVLESKTWFSAETTGVNKVLRTPRGNMIEIELPSLYDSLFMKGDTIK